MPRDDILTVEAYVTGRQSDRRIIDVSLSSGSLLLSKSKRTLSCKKNYCPKHLPPSIRTSAMLNALPVRYCSVRILIYTQMANGTLAREWE